jgi:hypothetical protein
MVITITSVLDTAFAAALHTLTASCSLVVVRGLWPRYELLLIHCAAGVEVGVSDPDDDDGYKVFVLYMPSDPYARPSSVSMA